MQFKKATRDAVKLKLGVQGPSGSGKTDGALALAMALAAMEGSRVALIDTENESASLYADRYDFDTLALGAPYESKRYVEALKVAIAAGYKVVVIDSLSHQWAGDGGILARKEAVDKRGGNQWTNWQPFTKEHEAFKAFLLNAPIHIIATLRTKTEYVLETNAKGKEAPKKVGTAPIQREGMEYEFSVMWELQMDHMAASSKDRTSIYDGRLVDLRAPETHAELIAWLKSGRELAPAPEKPADAQPAGNGADAIAEAGIELLLDALASEHITDEERASMEAWLSKKKRTAIEVGTALDAVKAKVAARTPAPAADGAAAPTDTAAQAAA